MKVLVATASRHGATAEVAQAIASTLRARGLDVDVRKVSDVDEVTGYDAVVLGSAIYLGEWLAEAREFVRVHQARLVERPVWLFSSGPVGDPALHDQPADLGEVVEATHAWGHRTFPGRLDHYALAEDEQQVVSHLHARDGDYRDWAAVRFWAGRIAESLVARRPA